MAIAYGSIGSAGSGSTSISVGYPSGISAGDMLVLCIANKYPTNGPSTPSGWTLATNAQGTGGRGSPGGGSGTVYITVFIKQAVGSESGSLSVTLTSANSSHGVMLRYTKASDAAWTYAAANTAQNTNSVTWDAVLDSDPGIQTADMVLVASAVNANWTFSLEGVTTSGVTYGTAVERYDTGTTTGDDVKLVVSEHPVSTGSSSGNATYVMTSSGSNTVSPAGATVLLRLRTELTESLTISGGPADLSASTEIDESQSYGAGTSTAEAIGTITMAEALTFAGGTSDIAFVDSLVSTFTETLTFDATAEAVESTRFWEESLTENAGTSSMDATHTLNPFEGITFDDPISGLDSVSLISTADDDTLFAGSDFEILETLSANNDILEFVTADITFEINQVVTEVIVLAAGAAQLSLPSDDILRPPVIDDRDWHTYSPNEFPLAEDARKWSVHRPLRVIIATEIEGMPTVTLLEVKDPSEVLLIPFRYDNLATGETISSATVTATVHSGTDATPSAIISGAVTISGSTVTQKIIGGVSGVVYKLRCSATTSASRTLIIPALLPVETF